jgi:hypothetical protein
MPINDTYVVPEHVVNFLCDGERSFLALRLIHGLLYALDTALRGKMSLVPAHFPKEHRVRTSTLAAAVGPEKAKDNRWIRAACEELADQNILQVARIEGRAFWFQLSSKFSAALSMPPKAFAIMRTDQVRQCRTLHDLMFLSLACLHGGKNHPRFLLPRITVRLEQTALGPSALLPVTPKQEPWRIAWSRSSRSWISAALRISKILDHSYLIAPRQDMIDDFVSEVAVKVQHAKTTWERGKLYKFYPGTRNVFEIIPEHESKITLNAEAFRHKWHQTVIQ